MTIICTTAAEDGTYAVQSTSIKIEPPVGWAAVLAPLEASVRALLPWVKPIITDGKITAVEDNAAARAAWQAAQAAIIAPPDPITQIQLALAELAELVAGGAG